MRGADRVRADAWRDMGLPLSYPVRNVRARLQHLYPGQHRFRVSNRVEGGVESLLAIPFRGPEVVRA